uniref:Uncharacterized protein n=1 Tax=Vitis vinifera TaxID=29760 RepID=F6HMU2_VITVI
MSNLGSMIGRIVLGHDPKAWVKCQWVGEDFWEVSG